MRRVYEARVRFALGQPPTIQQAEAVNVWAHLRSLHIPLYITEQTAHILQRRSVLSAAELLAQTQALRKGRYLRRWARRLWTEGIPPADAIFIAYGSFGVDLQRQQMGVEVIVTNDRKLAATIRSQLAMLHDQFAQMIGQLPEPYRQLALPTVLTTAEVLADTSSQ